MANIRDHPEYQIQIGNRNLLLDDKKFQLLKKINSCGSITKASLKAGIPYRTALKYIEIMERILDSPVVLSQRGGKGGGGSSQLTKTGKLVVKEYMKLNEILQKHAQLNEIEGRVKGLDIKNQVMKIQVGNHEILVPIDEDFEIDEKVLILVSPEDIFIMIKHQESSVRNIIKGKIVGMELKNKIVSIKIELSNTIPILVNITHYSRDKLNLELGKKVFIGFKAASLSVIKI